MVQTKGGELYVIVIQYVMTGYGLVNFLGLADIKLNYTYFQ